MSHNGILFGKNERSSANIVVVGVGGAGGNAVNRMIESGVKGVQYVVVNTDKQDLEKSNAEIRIAIGEKVTGGLGAGGNPEIGLLAAQENQQEIDNAIRGADMLFITAGMGGGTGTGAAPVVAKIAQELGILTIGIVTRPFSFEGKKRKIYADQGEAYMKQYVDSLVVIPNDKLLLLSNEKTTMIEAFNMADEVLKDGVQGIAEIITGAGFINVDFADVKSVMAGQGIAHMGIGRGSGEKRVKDAVKTAIHSPLLDTTVAGAQHILLRIAGNSNLGMLEFSEAADIIEQEASPDADVRIGMTIDESLGDEIVITVIATGFDGSTVRTPGAVLTVGDAIPNKSAKAGLKGQRDMSISFENTASGQDEPEIPDLDADEEGLPDDEEYTEYTSMGEDDDLFSSSDSREEASRFDIPVFLKKGD
ncbi:MAG: cell division protein FtsZ [Clostridiales Family XIII bacterium]|jgi:cell division protein FtsZ|nr:cell division protein FtsZ [Clostridiales Family XIII bacterium]